MYVSCLKRVFIILLITVSALLARAQENHFIYLQTENGQPFYVRLNNKVISSSPAGYLILPNLNDGDYQVIVGFPKNEFPEESFPVSVNKKNEGYLLKDFVEKGWALFNLQSLALIQGTGVGNSNTVATTPSKAEDDPFSKMLANVIKDSSLLRRNQPVIAMPDTTAEVAKDTSPEVAINDSPPQGAVLDTVKEAPITDTSSGNEQQVAETVENKNTEPPDLSKAVPPITKILSRKDTAGMEMVYVEKNDLDNNDTVRIFMPAGKVQNEKIDEQDVHVDVEDIEPVRPSGDNTLQFTITPTIISPKPDTVTLVDDTIRIYKEPVTGSDTKAVSGDTGTIEYGAPRATVTVIEPASEKALEKPEPAENRSEIIVLPKVVTSSTVNSDCRDFASNEDFLKLRKKMAAENNKEDMIQVAKKVFRTRCFSTEQIRNLSYLFLTNEGKYMFFDAAYPFVSDSDEFHSLASQLNDDYYIKRFNAMIHP